MPVRRVPAARLPTLTEISRALRRAHGTLDLPPPRSAFEWILWENVAYLAGDERRLQAFTLLRSEIGATASAIASAPTSALLRVTGHGILAEPSARKLRD